MQRGCHRLTKRLFIAAGTCTALLAALWLFPSRLGISTAHGSLRAFGAWHAPASPDILSQREIEGIVRQTTDVTCGPATLATLLFEYFHEPVTEAELYDAALRAMLGDAYGRVPEVPVVTFRGLMGALAVHGYTSYAVEADLGGLNAYFGQYAVPVILQLDKPEPHFTLLLGIVDGWYVLADPSVGHVVMTADELDAHWSGYALLVRPPAGRSLDEARLRERLQAVLVRDRQLTRAQAWL